VLKKKVGEGISLEDRRFWMKESEGRDRAAVNTSSHTGQSEGPKAAMSTPVGTREKRRGSTHHRGNNWVSKKKSGGQEQH